MTPVDTVRAFIAAINAHDERRIVDLCSDDHRLVDAHGGEVDRETLEEAWTGYFRFMPHYSVRADIMLVEGETVAVFGEAWGGLDLSDEASRAWRRPCAWRAETREGRIVLWQVYVDTKAVFDLF